MPVPAVTSVGLSCTSDVTTFDQNWHHFKSFAGGEDLFSDIQIKVTGSLSHLCMKDARKYCKM